MKQYATSNSCIISVISRIPDTCTVP